MIEVAELERYSIILAGCWFELESESDELDLELRILSNFCFFRLNEILLAIIGFGGFKNLIFVKAPIWF